MSFRAWAWHRNHATGRMMSGRTSAGMAVFIHVMAGMMGAVATAQGLWYIGLFMGGVVGTYKNWTGQWV